MISLMYKRRGSNHRKRLNFKPGTTKAIPNLLYSFGATHKT